jgi:hypothetical protein
MTTDALDAPTPEFRAHLEWEVARAFRREARLGTSQPRPQHRGLRLAALLAVCVVIGATSNMASAQVRDGSRRDSLLDAARADLALMTLRAKLAGQHFADVQRQLQAGVVGAQQAETAETELQALNNRVAREQLDIAEIQAASQPPQDELNAPLVGGRDFVLARIQLDLANAQQRLLTTEHALAEIERQSRAGVLSELAPVEGRLEIARAQDALAMAASRAALRSEFLQQGTPVNELTRRLDAEQLRQDIIVAQQALELAQRRAVSAEHLRAVGVATQLDALRAQVDVQEQQLALSRLAQRLRVEAAASTKATSPAARSNQR